MVRYAGVKGRELKRKARKLGLAVEQPTGGGSHWKVYDLASPGLVQIISIHGDGEEIDPAAIRNFIRLFCPGGWDRFNQL